MTERSYFWESCSSVAAFWAAGLCLAWLSQPWALYSTQSVPWLWPSKKRWGFSPRSSRLAPETQEKYSVSARTPWFLEVRRSHCFAGGRGLGAYLCFLPVPSHSSWRVSPAWFPLNRRAEQLPPPSATGDPEPHLSWPECAPVMGTKIFYTCFFFQTTVKPTTRGQGQKYIENVTDGLISCHQFDLHLYNFYYHWSFP